MAVDTEGDEILFLIMSLPATLLDMMNLQVGLTPAILTTPAVPFQDSPAQSSVRLRRQPETRSLLDKRDH